MNDIQSPTVEERLLAALSHGSVAGQGAGILVGLLVYITQRDKSRYAAWQGLQAAIYQIISLVLIVIIWVVWGVLYSLSFIPLMSLPEGADPPTWFWLSMGSMVIPFGLMLIIGLYGLIGAWQTWQGKPFGYIGIGGWSEKMIDNSGENAAQEG